MNPRFPLSLGPALRPALILLRLFLLAMLAGGGGALAQGAPPGRVALVVGVAGYVTLPPLPGAGDDAAQVAGQLQALGYRVTALTDPDRTAFDVALTVFATDAAVAEAALVYFAGHALGSQGATRLALTDSRVAAPEDAAGQTFPLEALLARLAGPDRPLAVVIDARTEALPAPLQGALSAPAPAPGTLLALAEGGGARTSLFARGWIDEVAAAGARADATLDAILAGLARRLAEPGKGGQRLILVSALGTPLSLVPPAPPAAPEPAAQPPVFQIPRFGAAAPEEPEVEPEPEAEPEVVIAIPDDLPRAVQTELARLGCYTQRVDGVWGRGSRAALADYGRRSNQRDLGEEPTAEVWLILRAARGTVCPRPAEPAIRGTTHAALAFSRATFIAPEGASNGWGVASNRPSAQVAASAAIRDCNNGDPAVTDCRVVLSFVGGCGALAAGGSGTSVASGVGRGATDAAARNAALADCRRRAGSCRVLVSVCTP
jgi:hypothetical protein